MMWTICGLGLFGLALAQESSGTTDTSRDVSNCPGYVLDNLEETPNGLSASLTLAGPACNAFGTDITNLTIEVTYETQTRLHVNIFDTANKQYTIPEDIIARPAPPQESFVNSSDLLFSFDSSPFAFWITRRSEPDAAPIFDTRLASLPTTPIPSVNDDNSTALDGFALVFEDEYLQLTSALPLDTNIYGLGEYIASSGFRRDVANKGSIQTMWARDIQDPTDQNMYGSHPFYLEHRFNESTNTSQSHGVFLLSAAGSDVLLQTPPNSNTSLIQYRNLGGTLDFYFFSGPSSKSVVEQYGELIGFPAWVPAWGFGFQLCRWGYLNINDTMDQVINMRAAGIPLEVMWNDIDLYHAFRDFTSDPVSFNGDEMRAFIRELAANNQKYIPILDAAVPVTVNDTDVYDPYTVGSERGVFVKNPDGSEYIGQVWPGYTVFPDWFHNDTEQWWFEAMTNWSNGGIEFSGIWLDMNEVSSFCEGSCGTGANLSNTSPPFLLPGDAGAEITTWPECYDAERFGNSGNITISGTSTCTTQSQGVELEFVSRGLGAAEYSEVNVVDPAYAIHNGFPSLSNHTLATNGTHANGVLEFDVHNMFGMMEEKATHRALQKMHPGKRPFIIARSTFPSSGKWAGHWLGDNSATWEYMYQSIQGVLQFQLFQIPLVGADTCGFMGNTDEELCNRWMQLSAFTPFYRNHNQRGALSQEPYRWDSVAEASRIAIKARYELLPYWYTLFANASTRGTPPVRALFFEFPNEPELFAVDRQFLVGSDILVTPVLEQNVTSVEGIFPGRGNVIWRDFWTHEVVSSSNGNGTGTSTATQKATLSAPISHIPVHIRSGSVILMHAQPAYTIEETRAGPYTLLVSLDSDGAAMGDAYVDDGISDPVGESRVLRFSVGVSNNGTSTLRINSEGEFEIEQKLVNVTVLGVGKVPGSVRVDGEEVSRNTGTGWSWKEATEELIVQIGNGNGNGTNGIDLNEEHVLEWA